MFIQTEATPNPATLKFLPGPDRARARNARHARRRRGGAVAAGRAPVRDRRRVRRVPRLGLHRRHQVGRRVAAAQARDPRRRHGALHVGRADPARRGDRGYRRADDEFFESKDTETVATIKELIETRVRPAVANDGGDITFRGFKDGVVYLDMKGACAGCPSSTATLRHGIQNLLRHYIPDVVEVRPMSVMSAAMRAAGNLASIRDSLGRVGVLESSAIADDDSGELTMRVLAIDTALAACSAAVLDTRHVAVIASETLPMARGPCRSGDAADRARDGPGRASNSRSSTASPSPPAPAASPGCGSASRPRAASRWPPASPRSGFRRWPDSRRPISPRTTTPPWWRRSTPGTSTSICRCSAPAARPSCRRASRRCREAVRAAMTGPARIVGSGAELIAAQWPNRRAAAGAGRAARRARHRLDRTARRRRGRRARTAEAALSARARRAAAGRRPPATPMIGLLTRLFSRGEPVLSEATPRDAAAIAAAARRVVPPRLERGRDRAPADRTQRAHASRHGRTAGWSASSCRASPRAKRKSCRSRSSSSQRGKGWRGGCSICICGRLAGLGTRVVFLEVDEGNTAARRLYRRAGFGEVGRREGYYAAADGNRSTALVLRRDLV